MTRRLFTALALGLGVLALVARVNAQPPGSPHETVKATVGGASISVEYGRPYMRGRKIMGSLVPYGQVWRTGADAATTLSTSKALVIGGAEVPSGKVTLFTLPAEAGWKLIINKQTGQWGLAYDPKQDLGRVKMTMSKPPALVETLKYTLADKGQGQGELRLEWEHHVATVPITVK